jgi:hypothetical protein
MLAREGHVGQHVVFAGVHQVGELGPAGAQLFGNLAPGFTSMDLHRFCSGRVLMLGGLLFEGHG